MANRFGKQLFANGYGHLQMVLIGWFWAGITTAKGAVRVIGFVKINHYGVCLKVTVAHIDITAAMIGFFAIGSIGKW